MTPRRFRSVSVNTGNQADPATPRAPASVIRTRVTWVCRPPATMCSGCAVATLGAHDLDHLLDRGRA